MDRLTAMQVFVEVAHSGSLSIGAAPLMENRAHSLVEPYPACIDEAHHNRRGRDRLGEGR